MIYCKFWSLDKNHDLIIDKYDLSRHNDGGNLQLSLGSKQSLNFGPFLSYYRH